MLSVDRDPVVATELTHKKPPRRRFIASRKNLRQMVAFGWSHWRHLSQSDGPVDE